MIGEVKEDEDLFTVSAKIRETGIAEEQEKIMHTQNGTDDAGSDDFDPRADVGEEELKDMKALAAEQGIVEAWAKPIARARPRPSATNKPSNPFTEMKKNVNPFAEGAARESASINPFADIVGEADEIPYADGEEGESVPAGVSAANAVQGSFNPFASVTEDDLANAECQGDASFDPFTTIHDDDAFVATFPDAPGADVTSPNSRINPFDKEPSLDAKFAAFGSEAKPAAAAAPPGEEGAGSEAGSKLTSEASSLDVIDEDLPELPPFHPKWEGDGWDLFLRQPTKKKLTQNRFWKAVYVRIQPVNGIPHIRMWLPNKKEKEVMQELQLQSSYNLCDLGLSQFDEFGKCHTMKVQYIFYRERVGVKADRITPTLSDLTRVRNFKGLKDLVHKPKTTMPLDHAPQTSELLKFGGLNYDEFKFFFWTVEDFLFQLPSKREKNALSYTKDEITADIVDEYWCDIDKDGHIKDHKARVRIYCLAFLTGTPVVELGLNDKRRRGKEIVGRHDIIPIKTEEWVHIESPEYHKTIDQNAFLEHKVIRFEPLDAIKYEVMRFRVRPKINKELPLQVRVTQSLIERRFELRCEVLIPGYHSHSRRAQQTPCEDIQIRFPLPEEWIYYFRVERHFKYGSLHATKRKPGKIKGFERLTMLAKGVLPTSLIEVSTGSAKYEHLFRGVVWRIPQLPERNQGAYKTHLFSLNLDLQPHDPIPESFDTTVFVEYNMANSTVSRAQIRSISIENSGADDPPDRWVKHYAKYEYKVEMDMTDKPKQSPIDDDDIRIDENSRLALGAAASAMPDRPKTPPELEGIDKDQLAKSDTDSSDSSDEDDDDDDEEEDSSEEEEEGAAAKDDDEEDRQTLKAEEKDDEDDEDDDESEDEDDESDESDEDDDDDDEDDSSDEEEETVAEKKEEEKKEEASDAKTGLLIRLDSLLS